METSKVYVSNAVILLEESIVNNKIDLKIYLFNKKINNMDFHFSNKEKDEVELYFEREDYFLTIQFHTTIEDIESVSEFLDFLKIDQDIRRDEIFELNFKSIESQKFCILLNKYGLTFFVECLTNLEKHSPPKCASIVISLKENDETKPKFIKAFIMLLKSLMQLKNKKEEEKKDKEKSFFMVHPFGC